MSEQFKVGTICIGQNHVRDLYKNGLECEIVGGLELREWYNPATREGGQEVAYEVIWANGELRIAAPQFLRKKHPPRSAKSIMREAINKAKQPSMEPA